MRRTNLEDRQDAIRQCGEDVCYENKANEYLFDISPPDCFVYLFSVFVELYSGSTEKITHQDIESYCNIRRCTLSQYELDIIWKMNYWANSEIAKMQEE